MQAPSLICTWVAKTCRATWLVGVGLSVACQDVSPGPQRVSETPERQFILEHIRIEERRDGRVLWTGSAQRSDGDLSNSDVSELTLVRVPQTPNQTELTIRSPQARLQLDAGLADLQDVRVHDPTGRVLHGGAAHYDEKAGTLTGYGPVILAMPSMEINAQTAVVWLREGSVEVRGPVEGRLQSARKLPGRQPEP